MSTALANATIPADRDSVESAISNTTKADLKLNRVIFTIADTISWKEKHTESSTKGFGGVYRPELKTLKHNGNTGMIYRCKLTVMQEKMDAQNKEMLPPGDVKNWETGYVQSNSKFDPATGTWGDLEIKSDYMVFAPRFPGHEVLRAVERSLPNGTGGIVEITALKGATRAEVNAAQAYYFPNWNAIQKGVEALPTTVREIEAHIAARLAVVSKEAPFDKVQQYAQIGREMLRSCTEYKIYGQDLVKYEENEINKAKVEGHNYPYSPLAEILLEQLEMTRKDDIATSQASSTEALVREMRADRDTNTELELRKLDIEERKLAIEEAKLGISRVPAGVEFVAPVPAMIETNETGDVIFQTPEPIIISGQETAERVCGKPKANGTPCERVLRENEESCFQHK